ncbi:MAG: YraN family protein [Rikenellaceae bacterium]|jgi:putative endonuclease|nr:YraN family protein [Rikenellaceae bacterium]
MGEDLAAEYLVRQGFTIRHTNWRAGRYELDIVAERGGVIHFVEVRYRELGAPVNPEESITPAKFRALRRAAEAYLECFALDNELQFDLVAVDRFGCENRVRYIPGAMQCGW